MTFSQIENSIIWWIGPLTVELMWHYSSRVVDSMSLTPTNHCARTATASPRWTSSSTGSSELKYFERFFGRVGKVLLLDVGRCWQMFTNPRVWIIFSNLFLSCFFEFSKFYNFFQSFFRTFKNFFQNFLQFFSKILLKFSFRKLQKLTRLKEDPVNLGPWFVCEGSVWEFVELQSYMLRISALPRNNRAVRKGISGPVIILFSNFY